MAFITVLAATKGGAGKSTISAQLAMWAHEKGCRTAIIDLDPQGSTRTRFYKRDEMGLSSPDLLIGLNADNFTDEIQHYIDDYDHIFVDTPGVVEKAVKVAMQKADLILIPLKPTQEDIDSLGDTTTLINGLGMHNKKAFILNQVKGARAIRHTINEIAGDGPLCGTVSHYEAFVEAGVERKSISEHGKNPKAITEIEKLFQSVCRFYSNQQR